MTKWHAQKQTQRTGKKQQYTEQQDVTDIQNTI